jgi:nucleotide-binding universal stress UspA family protein
MYDTGLVPTDGSDEAEAATAEGVQLTASDGTLHALSVVEELPMYRRSGKARKFEAEPGTAQRDHAEDAAAKVADMAAEAGIESVTAVNAGVPSRVIVSYAQDVGADAVVLGKRGLSDAAEDMLGSTTERVARNAPATVVSVTEA